MSVALKLYEELTDAGENKDRARLIAEAFEKLEERYPEFREMATQGHVRESELRLQKEIKEVELRLQKEIKEVELEIKDVESRLTIEIKDVESRLTIEIKDVESRLTIEIKKVESQLTLDIKSLEVKMVSMFHRQTLWIIGSVGAISGLLKAIEHFLK